MVDKRRRGKIRRLVLEGIQIVSEKTSVVFVWVKEVRGGCWGERHGLAREGASEMGLREWTSGLRFIPENA
jgi:hypothetical protein